MAELIDTSYEFLAPQLVQDLQKAAEDDESKDSYFGLGCESPSPTSPTEKFMTPCAKPERVIKKARRRWSSDHKVDFVDTSLKDEMEKLSVKPKYPVTPRKTFDGIELAPLSRKTPGKKHSMMTRLDALDEQPRPLELRSRAVPRKRKADQPMSPHAPKYLTLAESAYHFQRDTPPRFRSKVEPIKLDFAKRQLTVAMTPQLLTKKRARPSMMPNPEEREALELEEMKKFQVKSHPLNERILREVQIQPRPEPKPSTIPEPFNLTELPPKKEVKKEEPFKFTARGVPKSVTMPVPRRLRVPAGIPVMKVEENGEVKIKEVLMKGVQGVSTTNMRLKENLPLNSYIRGLEMIRKKEEKIKKIIQQENKAREFRATPMPSFLNSTLNSTNTSTCSMRSTRSSRTFQDPDESWKPFKARYPSVLYKKPFEPKKPERSHLEVHGFDLKTEKRAKEREEFDRLLKEKEERMEMLKRQAEEEKARKEEEMMMKLRKELVHKAQPVPPTSKTPTPQVVE